MITVAELFDAYPGNDFLDPKAKGMSRRELEKYGCGDVVFVALCSALCVDPSDGSVSDAVLLLRLTELISDLESVHRKLVAARQQPVADTTDG